MMRCFCCSISARNFRSSHLLTRFPTLVVMVVQNVARSTGWKYFCRVCLHSTFPLTIFSPICFLPRKTIHTLHTTPQTSKPQPDTREGFVLKTRHTTLHQPCTPCFSKYVNITDWLFTGSSKEFEKSARDLSFSISSVPRSGCNSAGLLDDG